VGVVFPRFGKKDPKKKKGRVTGLFISFDH
jgi:hypothetical protein